MLKRLPSLILFILLVSSFSSAWSQQGNDGHTLFLIGDCGEPIVAESPMGNVFRREVSKTGTNTTVLYMGDNIYPNGMPDRGRPGRERAEKIMQTQVDWIKDLPVKGIFIPGNHDWQHWGRNGIQYINNQQQWLDSLKGYNSTLLPRDGCPGPVEIPLGNKTVLVIIDTQWLLHTYDKPGEDSHCDAKTAADLMTLVNDIMVRHGDKRVIIAAHHPVITYGDHGGVFSIQDHLFPLTDIQRNLYIPLPVIGSLYPLYRGVFGHIQDVRHPVYKEYSVLMQKLLSEYPGSVYAEGHEHALQHIVKDSTYYIVSGSGSKVTHVKKKRYARFAEGVTGFVKMSIQGNGAVGVEYWQVDEEFPEGKIVYTDTLKQQIRFIDPQTLDLPDLAGKKITARASNQYSAGPWRKRILGENYRAEWSQEITVPVFDIGREHGGLTILQKGGGQQTLSLRLADSTGREYVLRSVEKYPENAVPEMFRKTFAQDLVQDQISASHPYAAIVVPKLAEAAGIYHTNPQIVAIPDDPRFGVYRNTFKNTLALYEERPDEDWSDKAHFGNSSNIIGTSKVLEKLFKDNDNQVDQQFVLRSRQFDLWIGDWDRHDDQWRWATFEDKKEETYRPIPRDRDQTFFVNEGILPKVWSRKWALPKFEGFDEAIDWPSGLSFNARYFDRSFLTEPSLEDWQKTARELQTLLTDDVIENAMRDWPEEIYKLTGPEVVRKLKARRANLVKDATSHYKFLARAVDVVGSNKEEYFEVKRLPDGNVDVTVRKINKERQKSKQLYHRVFKKGETREIRLYGLGGRDVFDISGSAPESILVRVIGGDDSDSLRDVSHVNGFRKKTLFYDLSKGNAVVDEGETGDRTDNDPAVNFYNRTAFKYNRLAPLVFGNYNPDDGLFIGGGILYQTEGFRKNPFKQRHIGLLSIAPRTNSYNFLYRGDFTEILGKWGLEINADIKSPNYVNNFFGLGNETEYDDDIDDRPGIDVDDDIDYYRFRFEEQKLETYLTRRVGKIGVIKLGPALQRIEVEEPDDEDRFIDEYARTLDYNLYDEYNSYTGVSWNFEADHRNDTRFTTRGAFFSLSGRNMAGVDARATDFSSFESSLSLYHSFSRPGRLVFAARVGGGYNTGNYEFYQAQILSGRTELRGFRKTRFYGDSKFYTNLEVRAKLFSIRTYLFPASFGLVGFHDIGRVWYENSEGIDPSTPDGKSDKWHKGWGGGIWFTPFNLTVLSIEAARSEEGVLGYVRLGFLF